MICIPGRFLQIADRVGGETFVYPEEIFAGDRFVFASDKQDGFFFAGFLDTGADEGVVLPAVGGFQDQSGQSLQFQGPSLRGISGVYQAS